jgi:DNA-binding MarR family transcriptional regulator
MYRSFVKDSPQASNGAKDAPPDAATGLVQLAGLVQGLYAQISQRHDLTPVQAKLLCILAEGPRGMADLAHCFGVEKAALTGLVDRVERRGLAKRTPVRGDRRALHVTLTEAGQRSASAFHHDVTAELEHLLSSLSAHDRQQFGQAMAAIIAACGAQGERSAGQRDLVQHPPGMSSLRAGNEQDAVNVRAHGQPRL